MVNITNSKSDTMDEKLKVMFLLLSLAIYTNSLMELKLFHQYACFVSHDFISLPNDPFLDLNMRTSCQSTSDALTSYLNYRLHAALIPLPIFPRFNSSED